MNRIRSFPLRSAQQGGWGRCRGRERGSGYREAKADRNMACLRRRSPPRMRCASWVGSD